MNRVYIMGHLGQKPELSRSKAGRPYTRLSVATKRYRGPDEVESTDWHSVFVFGLDAERCAEWLNPGALLFIEGTLSYWKLEQNTEQSDQPFPYRNAINADQIRFITYGKSALAAPQNLESLDNPAAPRNHNAVAHL